MTRLGAVITQAIVHEYGRDELLRRLAHPFCFQSFGAMMGMDIAAQVRIPAHRPRKTRRLSGRDSNPSIPACCARAGARGRADGALGPDDLTSGQVGLYWFGASVGL
jgi:hypothetical protein